MVYLADSISDGHAEIPYAVVAGVDPRDLASPARSKNWKPLQNNEIALVDWPGMPFHPKAGDKITVSYFVAKRGQSS